MLQWTEDFSPSLVTKFSVEKVSSLPGCSGVYDICQLQKSWSAEKGLYLVWKSKHQLPSTLKDDAFSKGTTWGCICHGKFGHNAGASASCPKGTELIRPLLLSGLFVLLCSGFFFRREKKRLDRSSCKDLTRWNCSPSWKARSPWAVPTSFCGGPSIPFFNMHWSKTQAF